MEQSMDNGTIEKATMVQHLVQASLQHGLTMEEITSNSVENLKTLLALKMADNTSENAA